MPNSYNSEHTGAEFDYLFTQVEQKQNELTISSASGLVLSGDSLSISSIFLSILNMFVGGTGIVSVVPPSSVPSLDGHYRLRCAISGSGTIATFTWESEE